MPDVSVDLGSRPSILCDQSNMQMGGLRTTNIDEKQEEPNRNALGSQFYMQFQPASLICSFNKVRQLSQCTETKFNHVKGNFRFILG